jgi:hypothetical protein
MTTAPGNGNSGNGNSGNAGNNAGAGDDDALGRELERVLRSEADTVQPVGDGFRAIREKIDHRRSRRSWLVPLTGIATVAAVGTIAFAVFGGTDPSPLTQEPGVTDSSTSTTTSTGTATPTPTGTSTGVAIANDPALAIWPFAQAADAGQWVQGDASTEWMGNMKLVAQKFVTTFGGNLGSTVTAEAPITLNGEIVVPVSRLVDNGPTIEVALVHLHQWGNGALSVTEVTGPQRGFTNLHTGDTLTSGQDIRGIHHVEDQYILNVYPAGSTTSIGNGRSAAISGTEWSTKVTFNAQTPTGSVVATDGSLADGGLGAMIAVAVRFDTGGTPAVSPSTATPSDSPSGLSGSTTTFVSVKGGRIAWFGTASGQLKGYLTDKQPGGGDSRPSMSPDRQWVYFLRGTGTCANEIARVPFPGGNESQVQVVKTPSKGYVFDTMSAGFGGSVTWIERNCGNDQNLALGWAGAANGASGRIAVNGGPPTFGGTPRLSPDATKLAVFYISGTAHTIHVYDVSTAKGLEDGLPNGCTASDGCQGIDFDWAPDGSFVVLTDPTTLVRDVPGSSKATPLYSSSKADLGTTIDVSKAGDAVFVWGPNGQATYFLLSTNRATPSGTSYTTIEGPGSW